jgi:hypothetical protein
MLNIISPGQGYNPITTMEVKMSKLLLALFVCMISVNAIACGGSKDEEEKKKFSPISKNFL